jgi:hypothetical protein
MIAPRRRALDSRFASPFAGDLSRDAGLLLAVHKQMQQLQARSAWLDCCLRVAFRNQAHGCPSK